MRMEGVCEDGGCVRMKGVEGGGCVRMECVRMECV